MNALISDRNRKGSILRESKSSLGVDERVWYDQFTSTDWVHDSIADSYRVKALRSRKDIRGRVEAFFDGTQGWILSALVGFLTACIAYMVDVSEAPVFDWKIGYCSNGFFLSEKVRKLVLLSLDTSTPHLLALGGFLSFDFLQPNGPIFCQRCLRRPFLNLATNRIITQINACCKKPTTGLIFR